MNTQKVTLKIEVSTLSIDAVGALLYKVIEYINEEAESGLIQMNDGDQVEWKTTRKNVTF